MGNPLPLGRTPRVSHEEFNEGAWSGSAGHYFQDFPLSKQFDLAKTVILLDLNTSRFNSEGYEWEVIDGDPTVFRLWHRYNNSPAPDPYTVQIIEGLSFVDYFQVSKSGTASIVNTFTETVSSVPNFADGKTMHAILSTGGVVGIPKSAGLFSSEGPWNMKMTDATTFQWKTQPGTTSATVYDFVSWRF